MEFPGSSLSGRLVKLQIATRTFPCWNSREALSLGGLWSVDFRVISPGERLRLRCKICAGRPAEYEGSTNPIWLTPSEGNTNPIWLTPSS